MGVGPAERDPACIASHFQRETVSGFDDESESAGPKFICESEKSVRDIARERNRLLDGIDEDRQGTRFGARLELKNALDGIEIEWIGGKAVESVRGNGDYAAAFDEAGGVVDDMPLRCFA